MSRILAAAPVPEEEDGVHGGRMKALASLNPASGAKSLVPCRRAEDLGKENIDPLNAKIARGAAGQQKAQLKTSGNAAQDSSLDVLFRALDSCESERKNSGSKPNQAQASKEEFPVSIKKWKPFCRQRSAGTRKRKVDDSREANAGQDKRSRCSRPAEQVESENYPVCLTSTQDLNEELPTTTNQQPKSVESHRLESSRRTSEAAAATAEQPKQRQMEPMFTSAAVRIAANWLELLNHDLKCRISALKKTRKRIRGVLGQYNRPGAKREQDLERDRWIQMVQSLDANLQTEGSKLEASLRDVSVMLKQCELDRAGDLASRVFNLQPQAAAAASADKNRALIACAASITSTAEFALNL